MNKTDWRALMPDVARKLLGDPPRRTAREWRYGNKGSLAIYLESGTWKDYEADVDGGVLGLIQRELQTDQHGALDWLTREGLLPGETARRTPQNPQTGPAPASAIQKPAEDAPRACWAATVARPPTVSDLPGPVQALRKSPPQALHHFTRFDQVNQLVGASEADPDLGFMARI